MKDCPKCGSSDIDIATSGKHIWQCQECGKKFS